MPRREKPVVHMERLTPETRAMLPNECQRYWYEFVANYVRGLSVLDVGAGTGYGIPLLAAGGASSVGGIDLLPAGPGVVLRDVADVPDGSCDVATCLDVLEHVEDDAAFLGHLLRVSRLAVFFSTPNWDRFHCVNPFHVREYTADELRALLGSTPRECWCTDDWPLASPAGEPGLKAHPPWRVPDWTGRETNFGVWLWKMGPLRHGGEPRFQLWNQVPRTFLEDDRANPARISAEVIVRALIERGCSSMVEIGPGPGFDYVDHFRGLPISYAAYEASDGLRRLFSASAPDVDLRPGGFLDLAPQSFDLVFTKATLEHQPDFRDGLRRMIHAARRYVLINFYLPPGSFEDRKEGQGVWFNRYLESEVESFVGECGAKVEARTVEGPPGNHLWLIAKP